MNFHRPELNYMTRAEEEFSVRFSPFINERNVLGISDELALARRDIAQKCERLKWCSSILPSK